MRPLAYVFVCLLGFTGGIFYWSNFHSDSPKISEILPESSPEVSQVIEKKPTPKPAELADPSQYSEDYRTASGKVVVPRGAKPTKEVISRMETLSLGR